MPTKTGYLTKQGGRTKSWKRRYFVLAGGVLKYYVNDNISEHKGDIVISGAHVFQAAKEGKQFAIRINPADSERTYVVVAANATELKEWFDALVETSQQTAVRRRVKEGMLTKLGGSVKTWKKRYFVLTAHSLQYFKEPGDKQCQGEIQLLCGAAVTPESDELHDRRFVFSVTPENNQRSFVLVADNDSDMRDWVRAIQAVLRDGQPNQILTPAATQRRVSFPASTGERKLSRNAEINSSYTHTRTCSGWLKKQGHVVRNWKSRFFVLSGTTLSYFKDEEEATPQGFAKGMRPSGVIDVAESDIARDQKTPFSFSLVGGETKKKYLLIADSDANVDMWITAIKNCNKKNSAYNEDTVGDLLTIPKSNRTSCTSTISNSSEDDEDSHSSTTRKRFAFFKNEDLPVVAREDYFDKSSLREGWMLKMVRTGAAVRERWHRRYFMLAENELVYYKNKPNKKAQDKKSKNLRGANCTLELDSSVHHQPNVLIIKSIGEMDLFLSASTEAQAEEWHNAITKQVAKLEVNVDLPADATDSVKESYMFRMVGDDWERIYFVLKEGSTSLDVYSNHDKKGGVQATYSLQDANIQLYPNGQYDKDCSFSLITDDKQWVCAADSREILDEWVNVIMDM